LAGVSSAVRILPPCLLFVGFGIVDVNRQFVDANILSTLPDMPLTKPACQMLATWMSLNPDERIRDVDHLEKVVLAGLARRWATGFGCRRKQDLYRRAEVVERVLGIPANKMTDADITPIPGEKATR
jgi:hypothetical protein